MTNRERVLRTLAGQETDRPPVAIIAGFAWACKYHNTTVAKMAALPDAGAQLLVDTYRELGSEIMYIGGALCWTALEVMGGKVDYDMGAPEITERPLKSLEDITKYHAADVLAAIRADAGYQAMLKQVRYARKLVGDDAVIAVGAFDTFTVASQMLGVDKFMENLLDDEEGYIDQMLDLALEIVVETDRDMMAAGGDLVYTCDPVASGDLISPNMYNSIVQPYAVKFAKRVKEFSPYSILHICGNTTSRLAPVAATGHDAFSVDSIDMVAAYEAAEGKLALMGNLNPAAVLLPLSADEVYTKSLALCKSMKGKRFILAPGCDLSPDTPLENILAMVRAAEDSANR